MVGQFVPEPGFEQRLRDTPEMLRARKAVAEQVVREAEAVAPEGSGRYKRSLQAVVDGAEVRAESSDPAAHLVEFGSINNEAYAPLRRGAERVGRWDEAPKP